MAVINVYIEKLKNISFNSKKVQKTFLFIFFFLALTILIFASSLPQKYDIKVGNIAQENIISKKDAINTIATRKLKQVAAESVPKKYNLDQNITLEAKKETTEVFDNIKKVCSNNYLDDKAKKEALYNISPKVISDETVSTALSMNVFTLKELETATKAIIEEVMEGGVKEGSIDRNRTYVVEKFKNINLPEDIKMIGQDIAFATIRPNMVYDKEATEKLQEEAIEAIEPVKIAKNQIIIEKGTVITEEHRELLKDLGLLVQDKGANINLLVGTMFLSATLGGLLAFSIYHFHKSIFENNTYLTLLALIILSTLIISIGIKTISHYLIPVAAGSMLISILVSPSIAVIASFIMSIAVGIMFGNDFSIALAALFGAITGVFCTANVSQRSDLTKAGGVIGIINFLIIFGLELLKNNSLIDILKQAPWGLVNGVLSAILAIGTLPFLENAFGITTSIKLLELSNPNQPLLRKLMLDAPGTYHHSIIVGNLAEAAAEAIGADPLLARVGASYHDVGKLKRPYFFIENQLATDNPHDKLNPTLSALIITSHVKDGLEISKEYNLPKCISDFIVQHHGKTLLSFFYNKAAKLDGEEPDETRFRYEGPKPQTKEIAIVMLADSCEAAVRSMPKPTPGKIKGTVRQIIKDKLVDGQLDESDLTLKDLDKVAGAFSKVLTGIFHTRIEYPDRLKELERKGEKNARSNNK